MVKAAASGKTTTATATTVKLSDYIITPVDLWRLGKALGWRRILAASGVLLVTWGALVAGQAPSWVVPLAITAVAIITGVDARAPFGLAISLLLVIAGWSAFDPAASTTTDGDTGPEILAVWAYYGLVLGVVLLLRDQVWPRRQDLITTAATPLRTAAASLQRPRRRPRNHTLDLRPKL
jgi:hypothetical protein